MSVENPVSIAIGMMKIRASCQPSAQTLSPSIDKIEINRYRCGSRWAESYPFHEVGLYRNEANKISRVRVL